jgi:hypothetical protein
MPKADEAVAHLMQIRDRLTPIAERLLAIEAKLATAKSSGQSPVIVSLREFTASLLSHKGLLSEEKNNECVKPQEGLANVR